MNKKDNKQRKVLLDGPASSNLLAMVEEVKAGDRVLQLTPSKLASWIVSRYWRMAFKGDKKMIRKAHFDYLKNLKEALKATTTDKELRSALAVAIKKVGNRSKQKLINERES